LPRPADLLLEHDIAGGANFELDRAVGRGIAPDGRPIVCTSISTRRMTVAELPGLTSLKGIVKRSSEESVLSQCCTSLSIAGATMRPG
jgi:hypothetical protein